jgi:hypothetical protein
MATGVLCAALATGGGAPVLMGLVVATGALVWAVLPKRPRLRSAIRIDPLAAPVALLAAALFAPYSIDQLALQNAATGYHAQNPHLFDMAWMALTLVVLGMLAAVLVAARRLVVWVALGATATGVAGLAFGESMVWSAGVAGLGIAAAVVAVVHRRLGRRR